MSSVKVIYIVSDIDKALAFEWIAANLNKEIDLQFILIGKRDSHLSSFLKQHGIIYYEVEFFTWRNSLKAWLKILEILWRQNPQAVHTHLWVSNLLGLSASWVLRIPKRIYTRHHATLHHKAHPSGLKWDKLINRLATDIIAISDNIREILVDWDKADPKKITLIHHGFDFNYFQQVDQSRIESLRQKYKVNTQSTPIIGVISRYVKWKGIQYIIPAFNKIRKDNPSAHLILANARGDYAVEIKLLLSSLPAGSYTEIRFEEDLAALYRLFDIFVHVPVDRFSEAFGQTYIEALLVGVPSIFTLSGIAKEIIEDNKNALVVAYESSDAIHEGIDRLLKNPELTKRMIAEASKSVESFQLDNYIKQLEKLYIIK